MCKTCQQLLTLMSNADKLKRERNAKTAAVFTFALQMRSEYVFVFHVMIKATSQDTNPCFHIQHQADGDC